MTPRRSLAFAALLLAVGLAGCGRRGPLELPPDVQQRGAALRAQEQAAAPRPRAAPGADDPDQPKTPIPGTPGNRPPEQYPFVLDPLLQ